MNPSYILENEKKINNKDQIKRMILFILITLSVIQQMPVIREGFYGEIRIILYIIFGLFSVISSLTINKFLKARLVIYFLITIIYSFILYLIGILANNDGADIFQLLVPFGILLCSLNTKFYKKQIDNLMTWYAFIVAILGVVTVFYYGQGFSITQLYTIPSKNQIGPLLGIAAIILYIKLYYGWQTFSRYNNKLINFGLLILIVGSLFAIRNRSGIVGLFIIFVLYLTFEFRPKVTLKNVTIIQSVFIMIFLLLIAGVLNPVFEYARDALISNYDITDIQSLSAGRTGTYIEALQFSLKNPIFGDLGIANFFATPHNYILYNWAKFGIIASLPLVLLYLYLWVYVFNGIRYNKRSDFTLPIWLLLFSLIVSVFEYTYPYGPGVSQLMLWFLLGQYIKNIIFDLSI